MSSEIKKPAVNVHVHFCAGQSPEAAESFRYKLQNDAGLRDFLRNMLATARKLEDK